MKSATDIIWECSPQKASVLTILLALARYANEDGVGFCFPDNIAELCGCKERYVRFVFDRLEEAGELIVMEVEGKRRWYQLLHVQLLNNQTAGQPLGSKPARPEAPPSPPGASGPSLNGSVDPKPAPITGSVDPEPTSTGSTDPQIGSCDPQIGSTDPVYLINNKINPEYNQDIPPNVPPQPKIPLVKPARTGGIYQQPPTPASDEFPFRPVKNNGRAPAGEAEQRVRAILDVCGLQAGVPTHRKEAQQAAAELSSYSADFIRRRYGPPGKDWNPAEWNWYTDDFRGRDHRQPTAKWLVETIAKTIPLTSGSAPAGGLTIEDIKRQINQQLKEGRHGRLA